MTTWIATSPDESYTFTFTAPDEPMLAAEELVNSLEGRGADWIIQREEQADLVGYLLDIRMSGLYLTVVKGVPQ